MTRLASVARTDQDALVPLRGFVAAFDELLARTGEEPAILGEGKVLLERLLADDSWLPSSHAAPDPARYRQYLLHRDAAGRFSVVSFVWGPGQATPVHDHRVWGLVGVLRGAELADRYAIGDDGLRWLGGERLEAGAVDTVSPSLGDLHKVANAHADRVSVSIHVYGADIGAVERSIYDENGRPQPFVSGYADAPSLDLAPSAAT